MKKVHRIFLKKIEKNENLKLMIISRKINNKINKYLEQKFINIIYTNNIYNYYLMK